LIDETINHRRKVPSFGGGFLHLSKKDSEETLCKIESD